MTDARTLSEKQLLHLADRARRGVLLPAEYDRLAAGITAMAARVTTLEHVAAGNKRHVQLLVPELERAEAAIERVRKLATVWAVLRTYGGAAYELRKALDEEPVENAPLVHPGTEQQANDPAGVDEPALDQPQPPTT